MVHPNHIPESKVETYLFRKFYTKKILKKILFLGKRARANTEVYHEGYEEDASQNVTTGGHSPNTPNSTLYSGHVNCKGPSGADYNSGCHLFSEFYFLFDAHFLFF